MKAAAADQARLLELQSRDNRLARLTRIEHDLPERATLAAIEAEQKATRADLATTTGTLEDVRRELARTESDVAVVEVRIKHDSERMMASSSAKDATAFEHELEALRRRQSDLEEIELAVMERVDEHETAVASIQARLDALGTEAAAAEAAIGEAITRIEDERGVLQSSRAELVGGLPEELVALYEQQRARYGSGASLLRRGVSEVAGVELSGDDLAKVRAAAPDDVLLCPSSSAILVRTGESGL